MNATEVMDTLAEVVEQIKRRHPADWQERLARSWDAGWARQQESSEPDENIYLEE